MNNNKEVKIAIIVGIIMITICLLAVIINNSKNDIEQINLKVYKNENREYNQCSITTDELITINREFNRATRIKEEKQLAGESITGTYMVKIDDNFVAFDADGKNKIYVSANGKEAIYELPTPMYEIVKKACNK
jgi:hypothetical protein